MYLIQISIETRIIIGIVAMVVLFAGFMIAFVTIQRKKLEYQQNMQLMLEQRQEILAHQNEILESKVNERTTELNEQKTALQTSLIELKSTQQQLIQSEKMASLGEMTSGIAHEIQNPLNFINNFSEVSIELMDEFLTEYKEGNSSQVENTGMEIKDILQKIYTHGKRADSIVKSMLEHTRAGTGKIEMANLNDLAQESLKLSFHGQKVKNRTEGCIPQLIKDDTLEPFPIITQDINRVLINLCNNAFYAVWKRKLSEASNYVPTVILAVKKEGNEACIKITDNGSGIPEHVLPKIFQPFFTTKPTGEGTGLGLSLSYDIITRAHGGVLTVDSTEGEGTCFTIRLPLAKT
jgi:two-component system, NtrC family, sensor kinase